jgi:ssDNA-binding Zn-finger/Zn-ribbon topoisomerase 1
MKAANGKRIGSAVPYGYVKDPNDHEKWLIDEPAAENVRKIYALCLSGHGPLQIAKQLESEQILVPSAYYQSVGRKSRNQVQNPYQWDQKTVAHILENRQYTGCTVNFISTSVSYKVHKRIHNPEDEWQIIPNTQEAIIDENTWLRVQELRKNKRRPTATGRKSLFSGLVFCPDCGAKLHFCASKSLKRNQEFFRCANYKDGRGSCQTHYIRDVVLQQIVLAAVSDLSDFVRCYESVFFVLLARQNQAAQQKELQSTRVKLEQSKKRVADIDRVISRLYEDNVIGKLSDERFMKMSASYEQEQKNLEVTIGECEQALREADKAKVDLRMLLKGLREFTELKKLTPEIVNTLIQRIEVHNSDRSTGKIRVQVDIYFTAIGLFTIPDEKELQKVMDDIRENPQKYKLSA